MRRPVTLLLLLALCPGTMLRAQPDAHRVIFALTSSDPADWKLTLANLRNLLVALPSAQVELVAYGAGVQFVAKSSTAAPEIALLEARHVRFAACANSMRAEHLASADLAPGVTIVPSGVAEVVTREEQGWSYIHAGR